MSQHVHVWECDPKNRNQLVCWRIGCKQRISITYLLRTIKEDVHAHTQYELCDDLLKRSGALTPRGRKLVSAHIADNPIVLRIKEIKAGQTRLIS